MMHFGLTQQPIDVAAWKQRLEQDACGALVTFEGWVRNHNNQRPVTHLVYSAYERMAQLQGTRIVQQALAQFAVGAAVCVHRIGPLAIGEAAIFVGVSAAHRGPAFEACRFILDQVKADVPIWKEEFYADQPESLWLTNNG